MLRVLNRIAEAGMIDLLAQYSRPAGPDTPKYLRVRDLLLRAISNGDLRPGDRLPTEQQIAGTLPISLGTVQRAYSQLVDEGIVVRERGRGSFVARPSAEMQEPWHCRFLDDESGRILPVYPRIISRKLIAPTMKLRQVLGIGSRAGKMLRIDRVINIGEEFDIFSRFYSSARSFPGLAERPVSDLQSANFKAILLDDYGLPIAGFKQSISTVPCPAPAAARISLAVHRPCQLLEVIAFARGRAPVYDQELFIPPTARKLVMDTAYRRSG
jgi:DNA-binding GntR family transcriptional regulator